MLDVYDYNSYKDAIRSLVKDRQKDRPNFTLKWLAQQIEIQYTYLSKVLNEESAHLSEDNLYQVAQSLGLSEDETDYLILLRSFNTSRLGPRRDLIGKKIEKLKKAQRLSVPEREFESARTSDEMRYLMNPLNIIVHAALEIREFARDPRRLCSLLGLSVSQLKGILKVLAQNQFVILAEDGFAIKELKTARIHFPVSHPFMRIHQALLKAQAYSRVNQTSEEDKFGFLVTFSMDEAGFREAKEEFLKYLRKLESISTKAKSNNVYQLTFDLFKWI